MPPDDATLRATLSLSAVFGGSVWGMYHLATTLLAGQPVHVRDLILAAVNVLCAIGVGASVAYFVGPVLAPLVPLEGLRDPHAMGFGIGAVAWEAAPFAYRWIRIFAAKRAGGPEEGNP
jgi:hypothetical protein